MLETSKIPPSLKESIIYTFKKEGKGNYLDLGAYRPIALENTLAKLVEKIVTIFLTNYAKKITSSYRTNLEGAVRGPIY
jgi:hypothetical protein